jgi:hypothetical protein
VKTLDVGTEFLFDKSAGVLDPKATALGRRFAWAFNVGVDGVSQRIRLGKLAPVYNLFHSSEYSEACKTVHEYVDPMVSEAIEKCVNRKSATPADSPSTERYTFLNALASEGLGKIEIRNHVLNIRK